MNFIFIYFLNSIYNCLQLIRVFSPSNNGDLRLNRHEFFHSE